MGERTPPVANRNTARDETIYMIARATALLDPDISDRQAAKLTADRLKQRFPGLTATMARNAFRAMKRSYLGG